MPLVTAPEGWRLDEAASPELHRVLLAAYGELGQREDPPHSNRGPRVDLYAGLVGASPDRPGFPWCVAFVRWCYEGARLDFPRTWSVSELVDWGAAGGRLVHRDIKPGDVFAIERRRRDGGEEEHHAGLVVANLGSGRLCCIEGNHGDQVAATIRPTTDFTAIVRIIPA